MHCAMPRATLTALPGLKLDKVNDCIYVSDLGGHIWQCNPHRLAFKKKIFESQTAALTGLTILRA